MIGDQYAVKFPELRQAFEQWATENGENMVSAKALGQYLLDRGCQPYQSSGRLYRGIGLCDARDAFKELGIPYE